MPYSIIFPQYFLAFGMSSTIKFALMFFKPVVAYKELTAKDAKFALRELCCPFGAKSFPRMLSVQTKWAYC